MYFCLTNKPGNLTLTVVLPSSSNDYHRRRGAVHEFIAYLAMHVHSRKRRDTTTKIMVSNGHTLVGNGRHTNISRSSIHM